MVGREAQENVIEATLDELVLGRSSVLLLTGEAGIGKSRMADEVVRRARSRGLRTAWAGAWQGDGVSPLWPWAQLLRQIVGSSEVLDRASLAAAAPSGSDVDPGRATSARFEQFEMVAASLREGIGEVPLVAVLDDAHWADAASLQFAAFAAASLRDRPFVLVVTYRPDELTPDALATLLHIGGTSVPLPPLRVDAVAELVSAVVGTSVNSAVVSTIAARSNGNPLFVQEYARLLALSGRTDVLPGVVPDGITAVIERRLARLPEPTVSLLQVAAVIGQAFTADTLAAVSDVSVDAVGDILSAAIKSGVLVLGGDDRILFAHDLIRQVALRSIRPSRAAALHLAAAEHHIRRLDGDATRHAAIADHLAHAGSKHRRNASQHWVAAAEQALARLAYEEAASCFVRARQLADPDPTQRCRLLLDEGSARMRSGVLMEARACFDAAADLARETGRADLLAEAALGLGVGESGWEVPMWDGHQIEMVRDALAVLPPDDRRLRSMLLARLSVAGATPETLDESRLLAEEAFALAKEEGDARLMAQALASLCDALGSAEHAVNRVLHARAIVQCGTETRDRVMELLGRRFLIVAFLELGRFADLDREIVAFERLAAQLHQPLLSWYGPLFRGMRALLAGDLPEAQRRQRVVAGAAIATGSLNADLLSSTLQIGIDTALGRPASGEFMLRFDIDPQVWASYSAGLAFVALTRSDLVEAGRQLRMHSQDGFARVGCDAEHLTTMMFFGRAAIAVGDTAALCDVAESLAPYRGQWIVDGIAAVCWGPVDLELARLAAAIGDQEAFERHRHAARVLLGGVDAPLLLADLESLAPAIAASAGTSASIPSTAGRSDDGNVLRNDGDYWTLAYGGTVARMRDAKGLHDLRELLARPAVEVHVFELMGGRGRRSKTDGWQNISAQNDLGPAIDDKARVQYVLRIRELQADLEDAKDMNDVRRAEQLEAERDFIAAELAGALGIGGRARRTGDDAERARKAVGTRIRLTLDRMAHVHPALERHLRTSIRTGVFCSYQPEHPRAWSTSVRAATPA